MEGVSLAKEPSGPWDLLVDNWMTMSWISQKVPQIWWEIGLDEWFSTRMFQSVVIDGNKVSKFINDLLFYNNESEHINLSK